MNKISLFLRICLLLLLLALMLASDSAAQVFESRIVFSSNRDGDWDIYSMDVNGNNLLQLTDHPATDEYPACSPNGRKIAFASERGVTRDLYVMDSDGDNVIRLTQDNFVAARVSWSPDSTKIVFSSFCKFNCDIFTMDADGNNRTRLAEHKWHDVRPSWSPDGSKIAFVSFRDGGLNDPLHIFVMNADGTGRRNLTGDTVLRDSWDPTWSPDGHKIAFHSQRFFADGTRTHIYVISADGEELEQLTDGAGSNWSPVYSPDGTKIAFESNRDGGSHIFLMDTNGMNVVKLTRTPPGIDNVNAFLAAGGLAVNPNGKLPTSWGELKRARIPR